VPEWTYTRAPGLRWTVQRAGLIVQSADGATHRIEEPAAALWDLLVRGDTIEKATLKMTQIARLDTDAAAAFVRTTFEAWAEAGIVTTGVG